MRPPAQTVVLNGAHGEGGSALFRTALLASSLTQQPVKIHHIRGATRKPGVTAEDLTTLEILRTATNAIVDGDNLGSEEITYEPRRAPKPVNMEVDIHSAQAGKVPGNLCVVLQAVLPILARTGAYSTLTLHGETHNNNTLCFDSLEQTVLPAHQHQGLYAFPSLVETGFGYAGHGQVNIEVEPSVFQPINWDKRGGLKRYGAVITATDAPNPTVRETLATCTQLLQSLGNAPDIADHEVHGKESGIGVTFFAEYENGYGSSAAVWHKGTSGAGTVERAWQPFKHWLDSESTTDPYLADQLLLTAAMTEGRTTYTTPTVTRRLTTMAYVIKQFMPIHITIKGRENTPGTIIVER